ncbi:hypothetical protein [Pseudomonas sp. NPDC090208]|uniref:hypothetical protein n=1 Tax=Pseudomonas sp. NPDC090208 TaxID=3364478 RepID=UPI0038136EC7
MDLIPLQRSAEYDDLEAQFKAMFLRLFEENIQGAVREANVYGMPHLGPYSFLSRSLSDDGLALMNNTPDDNTRYLFNAWKYLNPQAGTAFLEMYLRALFGDNFYINQLLILPDGDYPSEAISEPEIIARGEDVDDYVLTSRLQVDIDTQILPTRIVDAAKTAVAAKFVLDVRLAKKITTVINTVFVGWGVQIMRAVGQSLYHQREVIAETTVGGGMVAVGSGEGVNVVKGSGEQVLRDTQVSTQTKVGYSSRPGAATLVFGHIPRVDMQTYQK